MKPEEVERGKRALLARMKHDMLCVPNEAVPGDKKHDTLILARRDLAPPIGGEKEIVVDDKIIIVRCKCAETPFIMWDGKEETKF